MRQLFKQRRLTFLALHRKYLPYVLNDHFVLVLVFLLGYLLYQYSKLLNHLPENRFPIILVILALFLFLLGLGKPATYLEPADQHFLLCQERYVIKHLKESGRRSFYIWSGLGGLLLLLLYPLFLKLGFGIVTFLGVLALFVSLKWIIQKYKVDTLLAEGHLDWDKAIAYELERQQGVLKFYALFTSVKGLSSKFKNRRYLNFLLAIFPKKSNNLWLHLYARAFLRSSDYLGLFFRLTVLSCLSLSLIKNPYLALTLALVWNYLLFFQLLALYHHYNYYFMAQLYPKTKHLKKKNLLLFLRYLSVLAFLFQAIFCHELIILGGVTIIMLFLSFVYLPYQMKNIID
ncbi:ABC transporter [Streptococcus pseudoporcinus]|uniref:ABC transporter n=1 Tax=Streptococcus pseudoporcinus TaxID=361101 RepID=A0A4U9XR85_9STRE|nr:ABC transporter permease [Streptococcus pseudoporcinus]VTS15368.1 ABC transporter [Streptococcus pseudoporcinus]